MKNNIVNKSKKIKKYKKRGGADIYESSDLNINDVKIVGTLYNFVINIFEKIEGENPMKKLIQNINTDITQPNNNIFSEELDLLNQSDSTSTPSLTRQGTTNAITMCDSCQVFESTYTFFDSILYLVKQYGKDKNIFGKNYKEFNDSGLFTYYKLWQYEKNAKYITVDPTIIQFLIFDHNNDVHSLKIIYKDNNINIRYSNNLFPKNTSIITFSDLNNFNKFNTTLKINPYNEDTQTDDDLKIFLLKYYNLYLFYRKCIKSPNSEIFYNYHLKFISILGKARFFDKDLQLKCKHITEYILTNLLFINPSYAFISGGYKGFESKAYGITRSGYEISKQYNRPILTIMCNEGLNDSHQYSDATLIYGEHWGEDTIALSQFTDGAIIVAPFGGWTYVECLCLLEKEKIVGIYNDNFNILNYLSDAKNINFFKFNKNEQLSIIEFSINYYALIYSLLDNNASYHKLSNKCENILKLLFFIYEIIQAINDTKNDINLNNIISILNELLQVINRFKINIDLEIAKILTKKSNDLNKKYQEIFQEQGKQKNYQDEIPLNCDGLWIHPKYIDYIQTFYTFDKKEELKNILTMFTRLNEKSKELYKLYADIILTADKKYNIKKYSCWNNNKNMNKEIIFVFSNMISLGTYLTEKLDSTPFNNKIGNKIEELKKYSFKNSETLETIAKRYTTVKLKKNLDGYLDNSGDLINQNIVKNDYIFDIKDNCIIAFQENNVRGLQRSNTARPSSFIIADNIHRTTSMPQAASVTRLQPQESNTNRTGGKTNKKTKKIYKL
jgi:hypothetical protein